MARGLFVVGFTSEEVLKIQARAKQLVTDGKTLMTWGVGESQSGQQFTMPVAEVLDECRHALQVLDPATYGRRITRVRSRF